MAFPANTFSATACSRKPDRRDDRHLAAAHVRLVDDAPDAAEVVAVGVRVDDRDDRALAERAR